MAKKKLFPSQQWTRSVGFGSEVRLKKATKAARKMFGSVRKLSEYIRHLVDKA